MAKTLTVCAVEGRMLPDPRRRGAFIGWQRLKKLKEGEALPADAVSVPGGFSFAPCGPVTVPQSTYVLRALRRGDLVEDKPKRKARSAEKES